MWNLFTGLGEYYSICGNSCIKPSVAAKGAAWNLINCLKWSFVEILFLVTASNISFNCITSHKNALTYTQIIKQQHIITSVNEFVILYLATSFTLSAV